MGYRVQQLDDLVVGSQNHRNTWVSKKAETRTVSSLEMAMSHSRNRRFVSLDYDTDNTDTVQGDERMVPRGRQKRSASRLR